MKISSAARVFAGRVRPRVPDEISYAEGNLGVSASGVAKVLAFGAALLVLASLLGQFLRLNLGYEYAFGFVPKFNLDAENNVPTFVSALLLMAVAGLLCITGLLKKSDRFRRHWFALGAIFAFLAFDEAAVIHETLIDPLRAATKASGIFYYAWVIAAIPLVCLFLIGFAKFFFHLAPRFRKLVALAVGLYITGALAMELAGGFYAEKFGLNNWGYVLLTTIEETLELAGIVAMVYALTTYIAVYFPEIKLGMSE